MSRWHAVVAAGLLAVAACGDATGPSDVSGGWNSVFDYSGYHITLNMTLVEHSGTVTGSGVLSDNGTVSFTVTGTHSGATLDITLASPGLLSTHFVGQGKGSNKFQGTLNGSGFAQAPVTLYHN